MADENGFATYNFLVEVCTKDYDLVTSFGYKNEEKFKENITRKIMQALAGHPHVISITVDQVIGMSEVFAGEIEEEVEDE